MKYKDFMLLEKVDYNIKTWFGKSVVTNKKGDPLVVYHGTNKKFKEFKTDGKTERFVGLAQIEVDVNGVFFADNIDDAKVYGSNIIEAYIKIEKPLHSILDIGISSKSSQSEKDVYLKAWDDMHKIFEPIFIKKKGQTYFPIKNGMDQVLVDEDGEWMENIFDDDGLVDWYHLDNKEVVGRMKNYGYDGAKVQEYDSQSGYSWFVLDKKQIKILGDVK